MKTRAPHLPDSSTEQRYRTLLEIIPDIVYRIDPDGNFTFVSGCIRILGYEPRELIGKHFSTIIHPDDLHRVSRRMLLKKIRGKPTGEEAAPKLFDERRTGKRMTRWLEVRLIPKQWDPEANGTACRVGSLISVGEIAATGSYDRSMGEKGKKFIGTVGIIRDVTDRKREEEKLRKLEQQYQQAQKLESLGLLAGGVAHDFKNLLTIATGYLEIALERSSSDQSILLYLEKAMNALQRSKTLTMQLLNFSRSAVPKKKTLRMQPILRAVIDLAIGNTNVKPQFSFEEDLWPVNIDEGQIVQVIDNVIINSRQAMPDGGTIEIDARNHVVGNKKDLPLKEGKYVKVAIKDSGIGISDEHLHKIFDPFFTTKQEGSGLGLATSYFVMRKHEGHITAESCLGEGTTITLYLPASGKPFPARGRKPESARKRRRRRE